MQPHEQEFIDACAELSRVADRIQKQLDLMLERKLEELRYMENYDKQTNQRD